MALTENQREQRRFHIGSSDAPAILGVSPWKNAADVYWEKITPASEKEEIKSDAIEVGELCEEAVLKWFMKETGKRIVRNQRRVHKNGVMAANFDALVADCDDEAVEAKTTGITSFLNKDEWGEVETDQVPDYIIIQCQHQMAVRPELNKIWVPVLLGGVGFRKYLINRDEDLIQHIEGKEVEFWKNHVQAMVPPAEIPAYETIKKIHRQPSKAVPVADELVERWLMAKQVASEAEKMKDEAQRVLLAALGDAEAGQCSLGTLTFFQQTRKEYVAPASTFRVPRFKKLKGEVA